MNIEDMQDLFKKIPVQLPKPISHEEKIQSLLYGIGGDWCVKCFDKKLPPLKKRKPGKTTRERGCD